MSTKFDVYKLQIDLETGQFSWGWVRFRGGLAGEPWGECTLKSTSKPLYHCDVRSFFVI